MTSLEVLQPLKRTLTDLMDEDLYIVPNSPTHQFATQMIFSNPGVATNNANNNHNNSNSQALSDYNTMMMSADPAMLLRPLSALYNQYNMSTGTLSDIIPTDIAVANRFSVHNSPELAPTQQIPSYSIPSSDYYMFELGLDNNAQVDNVHAGFQDTNQTISPFNEHSNPELHVNDRSRMPATNNNNYNNLYFPANRITTLGLDNQSKKEEETLDMLNTDISPSYFVEHQPDGISVSVYDGFDYNPNEDFEEDLSDDDDDGNNFFQDIEEEASGSDMNTETQFVQDQPFFSMTREADISATQDFGSVPQINGEMFGSLDFDTNTFSQESNMNSDGSVPDLISDEDDEMMFDDEQGTVAPPSAPMSMAPEDLELPEEHGAAIKRRAKAAHHSTAAEISATNPDHLCNLINPNTRMPCNRQFSRPYDLIRHQETIHAARKKVFRCVICEGRRYGGPGNGNSKTFSRNDALSRHIKIKHGIVGDEAMTLINDAKLNVEYKQDT